MKIKDLAVLCAESAFSQFPLDGERYELAVVMLSISLGNHSVEDVLNRRVAQESRISDWLCGWCETFLSCAASLRAREDHDYDLGPLCMSKIALDRARRCEATLRFWHPDLRWTRIRVANPEILLHYLWEAAHNCVSQLEVDLGVVP